MSKAPTVFGIDLGTTFSVIAHMDAYQRPAVIPNAEGELSTPSVVQFDGDERIVGKEARNSAALFPDSTVQMIKRHMGSPVYSFEYNGQQYSPQEIASYILRRLAKDAAAFTGEKVNAVVVTCPAYFGVAEREATATAAQIAGLELRSIINEPTAAAIAYGLHEGRDQTVLVYDLGGGTFDVSVIEIRGGDITVIATDGDHFLGGRNWDELIVTYLAEQWQHSVGSTEDPLDTLETLEDLFIKAMSAKHTLSQRDKTEVRVVHQGQTARIPLSRERFNRLTEPLLLRTIELTRAVMKAASARGLHQIDQILLVGGSTRMPQVSEHLQKAFSIVPHSYEPDLAIAKGAAIYGQKLALDEAINIRIATHLALPAGAMTGDAVPADILDEATQEVASNQGMQLETLKALVTRKIQNVTSRSFGVLAWHPKEQRDVVSNLIRRNTPVPAAKQMRYGTRSANQSGVLIQIMENLGEDDIAEESDSRKIGEAELILPGGIPAQAPIDVTFSFDEQGRLHIRALDLTHGREVKVIVATEGALDDDDVADAQARGRGLVIS